MIVQDALNEAIRPPILGPADAQRLQRRIALADLLGAGQKIGISWRVAEISGSPAASLRAWGPILSITRRHFISLQQDATEIELRTGINMFGALIHHFPDAELDGFAALTSALDLVITVDHRTAQLAWSSSVPCWALLPPARRLQWFVEREESHWNPNVRLFCQSNFGDSRELMAQVARELEHLAA